MVWLSENTLQCMQIGYNTAQAYLLATPVAGDRTAPVWAVKSVEQAQFGWWSLQATTVAGDRTAVWAVKSVEQAPYGRSLQLQLLQVIEQVLLGWWSLQLVQVIKQPL